ncbi:hypothetical protein EF903_06925 [Streptomyces sp. WAC05292]|uniref:hypothetical protein n=1 Tax=Streptomyces sp. WAC05292 TaxID=2487418 RepID=UPI000F73A61B|nr:hypothetical protein [Streptomyces sp. WAC05292]RSS94265.1 hypothetical protein EF903_06925 [Streptomyces sp. WAC05292]
MANYTPKLTNVRGTDGTSTAGRYAVSDGVCTFTAMIVANKATEAASAEGFGLTLPVRAASGVRYAFQLNFDGRDADNGIWSGEASIFAGSDGTKIDRLRTPGTTNAGSLQNIGGFYGDSEGAAAAEIVTVTGSYPVA